MPAQITITFYKNQRDRKRKINPLLTKVVTDLVGLFDTAGTTQAAKGECVTYEDEAGNDLSMEDAFVRIMDRPYPGIDAALQLVDMMKGNNALMVQSIQG